jgi:mono/diheme cytochrome c family protein
MRRALLLLAACTLLGGCERAMQDMYDDPHYKPYRPSGVFADGTSARPLPPQSVIRASGMLSGTTSGLKGEQAALRDEQAESAQSMPYPITRELLERGRDRYTIYCEPCHSPLGDGDGLIPRHGFPHPPSYHSERLRKAPDRHFFDVITHGYGIMYSYADRVSPPDRWAIVAYIRALQLSQSTAAAALPPDARAKLAATGGGAPR